MKKAVRIIVVLAVLSAAGYGIYTHSGRQKNGQQGIIKVSGNVEATEVRLSFRVPGKIKELLADEGKYVKKGEAVARLDTDELEKQKAEAEASQKAAQFTFERAQDDYERAENLLKAGSVPQQKRDAARTAADSARANVEALKASLDLANTRLGFAELASPTDGFILVKSAEAGEVVQAGATVFTVGNLRDVWVTAYVNESSLGRVKLNQPVDVRTDTYPDKAYSGRISFISQEAEFTPKQIQTQEERVKLVYRIKIAVDNENMELKPGMPADAFIRE
jgi:HlyD family secretion protein